MISQLSHPMPVSADIVVDSLNRQHLLLVECMAVGESKPADAIGVRRGLIIHGYAVKSVFFMVAFSKALYLWQPDCAIDAPPTFTASPLSVLREYLGRIADQPGGPLAESLELAISSWLGDLAGGLRTPKTASEADQMLLASGLYDQIKGGDVRRELEA
jgi:hypothetical protein